MPSVAPLALALAVALSTAAAHAQSPPESPPATPLRAMPLPDALAWSLAHHPRLREAAARFRASQVAAELPRSQWLPRVGGAVELLAGTANNSTAGYLSTQYVSLPRIGATGVDQPIAGHSFAPYASSVVAVGVAQEVFDFGRIAAQSAAADALVDADRERAASDRFEVELAVREAHYAVLAAHAVVAASDDAFVRARAHQQMAEAWVARDLRPRIELLRSEAETARYEVGRIRARAALATAQQLYAAVVGVDEAALDATGDLAAPPPLPPLTAALQRAAARDPALLELTARLRAQQAQTRAIGAQMRPDLQLTGSVSGRAGGAPPSAAGSPVPVGDGFLPVVPNYNVGLVLNVPIYDGTLHARARASEAQESVLAAQGEVARQRQVAIIEQVYTTVQAAEVTLPALERAREAARGNYEQAEARFQAGLGTSVELADAEALRTEAEIQIAQGRFQLARARAQFDRSMAEEP